MGATQKLKPLCCSTFGLLGLLLVVLATFSLSANGEFYSSVDSLKQLGGIESTLLQSYRKYLKEQREDLDAVRRFMERIEFHHTKAKKDMEDYLGNPINAFTLIKRVVQDWGGIKDLLKFEYIENGLTESLTQLRESYDLPDESELTGAIMGLARLQDIYSLNAEDMANGKGYGSSLTWRECFEIATTYSDKNRFDLAWTWLNIANTKLQNSTESTQIKDMFSIQMKENLAFIHNVMGTQDDALEHLEQVLENEPRHNTMLTQKYLSRLTDKTVDYVPKKESDFHVNYADLCKGKTSLNGPQSKAVLKCRLDSSLHPYFTLSPLQIEPVHENPPVTLYHKLLDDEQISKIVERTKGNFFRSQVNNFGKSVVAESRVSQQIWLMPDASTTTKYIYKIVKYITGFNITNAEQMQVANYGIGGQYTPHHDYFVNENKVIDLKGNRISTNMIYLSEVEKGGHTVFPYLNLSLKPVKGSMVMWYNLHKSLEPDVRTWHSGCPVLKGSKRIANIWTRSWYQDIVRPCGLTDDKVTL